MQKYSKTVPAYNRYLANINAFSFGQVKLHRNDSESGTKATSVHLLYVLMTCLANILENILNEKSY